LNEFVNVARVLNSIFREWSIAADQNHWNISGELCSGNAIDSITLFDDFIYNPFIKCDCSYNNGTTCHITALYVPSLFLNFFCFNYFFYFSFLCLILSIWNETGRLEWMWLVKFHRSYGLLFISPICMFYLLSHFSSINYNPILWIMILYVFIVLFLF
jgi:hypothetical protein